MMMRALLTAVVLLQALAALASDASVAQHNFVKGLELARHRQYKKAADLFETVLVLNPADAATLAQLGHCRYYLGEKTAALEAYERYLAKAPAPDPRIRSLAEKLRQEPGVAPTPTPVPAPATPVPELKELVVWLEESKAKDQLKDTGKPILYDFTAAWCGPCKQMNKEVFSNAEQAAWINQNFSPVRVMDRRREEGRNQPRIESLQRRYSLRGFPTLVVDKPGASFLSRHQTTIGYPGVQGVREFLEKSLVALKE